jgi:hypothetical protein
MALQKWGDVQDAAGIMGEREKPGQTVNLPM